MSILNPINDLVAWVIMHIYGLLTPAFGATSGVTWLLTIVILVVLMRMLLLPLFIKQMHTQRAMTALTPKLTEIRKKYKGDRERLNQETMKVYQEAGVNPLMGCLPVLLQMPLFFALFSVLRAIATPRPPLPYHLTQSFVSNAARAQIFGASIKDKVLFTGSMYVPLHAKIVIVVVVLISMGTTYLTMRQNVKRGMMPAGTDSPMGQSQRMMTYVMPLFALTGLYWPLGLVLYWVTTNLWTLGQQFVLLRKYPIGAAALAGDAGAGGKATGAAGQAAGGTGRAPAGGGTPKPRRAGKAAGATAASSTTAAANGRAKAEAAAEPAAPGTSPGGTAPNGHRPPPGDGGLLRRFGRGRSEPGAQEAAQPAARIVRQQRIRQPRSKRSGRR